MALELACNNEEKIPVTINPLSAAGKPARVDGAPTWTVTSGTGTVAVAADGLSAEIISGDDPGDTTYLVDADADLGEGVVPVADTITLHVAGALAANLGLSAGAAIPK